LFQSIALNRRTDTVVLGFDKQRSEVHVSISMQDGSWAVNFVYDTKNDCIQPDSYAVGHVPSSYMFFDSYDADERAFLSGCYDGYIRKFDNAVKQDDGTAINSYWMAGPIFIGNLIRANAKINEIVVYLSEDTDNLNWSLYAAESAEALVKNIQTGSSPLSTGTFTSGGKQFSIRDKVVGEFIGILFNNSTIDSSWGIERIGITLSYSGADKEH
jgi:hypothetical protein